MLISGPPKRHLEYIYASDRFIGRAKIIKHFSQTLFLRHIPSEKLNYTGELYFTNSAVVLSLYFFKEFSTCFQNAENKINSNL